jgi:hypothetical protein
MSVHALAHAVRAQHGPDCIAPLALALFYNCGWPTKPAFGEPHWINRAVKLAESAGVDFVLPLAGGPPVTDSHGSHNSGQVLTHHQEVIT